MPRSRLTVLVASAATGLACVAAVSLVAAPASATSPSSAAPELTVSSDGGLVVDDAVHRVFVGDTGNSTIMVADETGALVGTVAGITGVTDLAVSADGSTVYAAAAGGHEIDAIDASDLTVTQRYIVPTTTGPTHLAVTDGTVWFSYGDQWSGDLGSVDLESGTVAMGQFSDKVWGQALLSTSTSEPGLLAVGETGLSTDSMAVLDVSSGTPVQVAWYHGDYSLNDGISDIDVIPGSDQVLVNGHDRDAYANGGFTADGSYPSTSVRSADVGADGRVAQAAGDDVAVYSPLATLPSQQQSFGGPVEAVAWSPDQSRLFALVQDGAGGQPLTLEAVTSDAPGGTSQAPTSLSLSLAPKAPAYGQKVTVTAHLGETTDRTLSLSLSPYGEDTHVVAAGPVDADGDLSFTFKLTRRTAIVASFAGDASDLPARATTTVTTGVPVSTSVSGQYRTAKIGTHRYHWFHKTASPLLVSAIPYLTGRAEEFQMQVRSRGAWATTVDTYVALNSYGRAAVKLGAPGVAGIAVRVRASYVSGASGDTANRTSRGKWIYIRFTR